ncbi:MAG: adenosylcobinamide-GDP ribazoletransferase [Thiohalocapsa sp.]|nr:adenosylcobinamide-GDP ribazoletransferase [Thiohalocapsa sp.]
MQPPAAWRAFLFAARFLTRLPLPDPGPLAAHEQGWAALFYPVVGLLSGALLAIAALPLSAVPALAGAAVLLILWTWLSGALHLDGLADCADAWVGGLGSRERTLQIMKDPHSGAMAVAAVTLVLLAKLAGLAALLQAAITPVQLALLLLWLPALARAQLPALALTTVSARAEGLGAALRTHLPRRLGWLVLAGTWLLAALSLGAWTGMLLLAAAVVLWRWRRSMLTRLGGFTGDTAGALVELTETAMLLGIVMLLPQPAGV